METFTNAFSKGDEGLSRQGMVFNIQRFTIHDGPGIRTEIFLKGCPLSCEWCSNPESWEEHMQLGVLNSKCLSLKKCGACVEACPEKDILAFKRGKLVSINYERCTNCLACLKACPSDAIKQWGTPTSVEECMKEIRKDKGYYERSGGGVTVSGGEPLLQSDFVTELFKACKNENIQTCCETSLFVDWSALKKTIPLTDIFIADIKHMDSAVHKIYTGIGNELALENLVKLVSQKVELILRIPIIPNVNDNMENIEATADFIINKLGNKVRTLQLLSFMRLGEEKYASLAMPYKMKDLKFNRKSFQKNVQSISDYFNSRGIHCLVGTKEKQ